ncbi:MAG: S41 family peptidase [Prevotella sp.]|nr:S41 family peptidase [Prevotella sp.]
MIVLALSFAATLFSTNTRGQGNHNLEVGKNMEIFNALYSQLDLFYVDTLNPSQAMTAGINGMLRSLDPYTEYYPQEEAKKLEMMLTGKYAGIGAVVKYHQRLKRVVIDEPYEGMPAAEAGVKKGDIIISIDDSMMTDKTVNYVSSHLRGDPGTTFVLKVKRPSTGKEMKFRITRRNIKLPEVTYYGMRPDSIAYIGLNQFSEGCAKEVRRAFIELKKQGAKGLVFDLRGNGGGSEMEAVNIVNIWVPQGEKVVENRGKVQQANHSYSTRLEPVDTVMPIVVLVNGETASASEITSGALQDLDRAVVMGTRTYGKGLVQIPLDLPYQANVKITTSKYYIPSGRCIQAINYNRENGAAYTERIPDSLTHVFYTRNGREVRDGGGIKPDIEVKNDTMPNIAYYLSVSGMDSTEVAFDYEVDYLARHDSIAAPCEFHLTEQEWQEFRQRVIDSGFTYDDMSRKQFDELVKTAKLEGFYDNAKDTFDALGNQLTHNVGTELDKHRKLVQELLELDIISAYYYQKGATEAGLNYDKQLLEAEELLKSPSDYHKVLAPRNAKP